MDALSRSSTSLYSGWRRKIGYERLRKNHVEYKRLRFWKIKLRPRLKLKLKLRRFSPKKLLINMRDAYVNMMMKMANTRCMSSISGFDGGFGNRQLKEYDEKVLVEIYKSMIIAQGQLVVPRNATGVGAEKFGTQIMCQQ